MKLLPYLLLCLLFSCKTESNKSKTPSPPPIVEKKNHTPYSNSPNESHNFNSVNAINKIAAIENEHFQSIKDGLSRYYGTVWREGAEQIILANNTTQFEDYLNNLPPAIEKPDSLHCTLYAYEGLKAGLTKEQLVRLEKLHQDRWKSREIAGWSVGYLLVKHFDWKAYLVLDPHSNEYEQCIKSFEKNKSYPVWRQPDIPLEKVFEIGKDNSLINDLLLQHEFGWGFSEQGIHTWITRYDQLKECNWLGVPAKKYQQSEHEKPLFITTAFRNFFDYHSHVIIVPPKKRK